MASIYLAVLGYLATFLGCISNAVALYSMRKEKSLQMQKDLLTCVNASSMLNIIVISLWWVEWLSHHGQGFEKAIYISYNCLHLFYILAAFGMTLDRLVAVTAPLQYKAMPLEIIHRIFIITILAVSLILATIFAFCYKNLSIAAYSTLVIDACFLLATTVANIFIQRRWIKRMSLAKKIGAIGRVLQKFDTSMLKIGGVVALCATLSALADIYLILTELKFPAKMKSDLSGFIVLLISCLYIFQPLYCTVVGLGLSAKDINEAIVRKKYFSIHRGRKQHFFRNMQPKSSWANL